MMQSSTSRAWAATRYRLQHGKQSLRGTLAWRLLARSSVLRRAKHSIFGSDSFIRPKHFIQPGMTIQTFFEELDRDGVSYVVLRWFEDLPAVVPGRDLDILVHEDHAERMSRYLVRSEIRRPDGVACDIYSSEGGHGDGNGGVAYYPPRLAERILARSERHQSGARVPCLEDHFYSLAFHTIYHKGPISGLPFDRQSPPGHNQSHDYTAVLSDLAARLDLDVPINVVDLDDFLGKVGWRPPLDTLGKWSAENEWCLQLYEAGLADIDAPKGLLVAIVREEAVDALDDIVDLFRSAGFTVNRAFRLDDETAERAANELRGGNWGAGPYPHAAGIPRAAIIAVDPAPVPPSESLIAEHPGIDNARIKEIKTGVRDWWNRQVPRANRCNVLHTSDSAAQAAHYLSVLGIDLDEPGQPCADRDA